jgi:cytochrome oxidase Cu insertion factor (SCO1/SenC/PrrC family)
MPTRAIAIGRRRDRPSTRVRFTFTPADILADSAVAANSKLLWAGVFLAGVVLVVAVVGIVTTGNSEPAGQTAVAPPSQAITWPAGTRRSPAFTLRDEAGKPLSLAGFHGRTVIVTFIDPLCRNYCPIEARRLMDAVRSVPATRRPAIVAVSVNLHGNGAATLAQDRRKWNLTPDWHWGVGTAAQLAPVWKRYEISVMAQTKKVAGVKVNEVAHTEAAYVVDGKGFQRALFIWPYRSADVVKTLGSLAPAA